MWRAVGAAAALLVVGVALPGCSSPSPAALARAAQAAQHHRQVLFEEGRGPVVRLGVLADAADATGLAGVQLGYFAQDVGGGVHLNVVGYTSAAAEAAALGAGQLDAAYIDPVAALTAWRATGGGVRVVSGAGSGGAELVVARRITSAAQLAGQGVAAPAGSSQAAALTSWLRAKGVTASVDPAAGVSGAAAVAAFSAGKIAGAWEPAPFDAQLVAAGGHVLQDEAVLWPDGLYATALLVVRQAFLSAHAALVVALLKGQLQANTLINTDRVRAEAAAGTELGFLLGAAVQAPVLAAAFGQVTFTNDPVATSVVIEAEDAAAAGLVKSAGSLAGLYDLRLMDQLLRTAGQQQVQP
jgi:NitT/TauT family transport system substrate-binding protein